MFVLDDIILLPRFFNPRKPRNENLNPRKKPKMRKLLPPRRNKMGPVDTVIQEITDEDCMIEDITIKLSSTVESA